MQVVYAFFVPPRNAAAARRASENAISTTDSVNGVIIVTDAFRSAAATILGVGSGGVGVGSVVFSRR
jgi:hypothetical protein